MSSSAPHGDQVPPAPPVEDRVPWGIGDVIGAVVIGASLLVVLSNLVVVLAEQGIVPEGIVAGILLLLTGVAFAAGPLIWVGGRFRSWRALWGHRRATGADIALAVGAGVIGYLAVNVGLVVAATQVIEGLGGELPEVQRELRSLAAQPELRVWFLLATIVAAPIGEELFFRGLLFPALAKRLRVWGGIIVSAAIFAGIHVSAGSPVAANVILVVLLFPLGILLAWLYHRRATLLVPIGVHVVFNAISSLMILRTTGAV
jgi:uncharacterized protein